MNSSSLYSISLLKQFQSFLRDSFAAAKSPEYDRYYYGVLSKCKTGVKEEVEKEIGKLESKSLSRCRGQPVINYEFLVSDKYQILLDSTSWGPMLNAFAEQKFEFFYQLLRAHRFNLRKELTLDPDEDSGESTSSLQDDLLLFKMAVHFRSAEALHLLLSH